MKSIALFVGLITIALSACVRDSGGAKLSKSRGVVLSYPPEQVWEQTKVTFSSIGRVTRMDEDAMLLDVAVGQDTLVLAAIEPYDRTGAKAIVRISARKGQVESPDLASQVLGRIQEQLLRLRAR